MMIERMSSISRNVSFKQRASTASGPRLGRSFVGRLPCKLILIGVGLFATSILGYLNVIPNLTYDGTVPDSKTSDRTCNMFDGNWVVDDSYPLYNASECPFIEQGFNCLENGRTDKYYLKWRWKPKNCDIPGFSIQSILQMFQNKRIVFVGDSMSRTEWESLICMLMTGVEDKKSVYEVNGNKITKQIRFLGVRFSSFNFTVEFFRSVFLVQHSWAPKRGPKRVRSTLKLDKLDDISNEWADSDVLIFNSGQWWVPGKLFGTGCYFQVGKSVKLGMSIATAFRTALSTWSSWVDTMVNPNRTHVFFRTFEPSHWSNQTLHLCDVTNNPLSETQGKDLSPFSDAVFEVVKNMKVPVTVLHITPMSAFRSDAHVGIWSDGLPVSDCSHWCLPGVPDTWNEILLSYLLSSFKGT